jgi:outer membrane protein assembly factor BamB
VSETVLIDLGEVRDIPDVAGPRPPSPRRYRAAGALLALALIAGVGGSARPAETLVAASAPAKLGDYFAVREDRLYVVGPNAQQRDIPGRTIAAYSLPTGRWLWQAPLPLTSEGGELYRAGGAVVIPFYEDADSEVVVLDDASGALLWRRRADFYGLVAAPDGAPPRGLLADMVHVGATAAGSRHEVVDMRTGATVWSYRSPPDAIVWPAWDPDSLHTTHLLTGLQSGRAEVRDLATGSVVAAATLRSPVQSEEFEGPDGPPGTWISTDGDVVLVEGPPGRRTVTAYGLGRLDLRWSLTRPGDSPGWFLGPHCGDVLCIHDQDGYLRAIERRTGRERWRSRVGWAQGWGPLLLASNSPGFEQPGDPLVLIDPATGRQRHQLGRWGLAGFGYRPETDGWVLWRYDAAPARVWVGLLTSTDPDVQLLGTVDGVAGGCTAGSNSFVCRRLDGSIGIWRYR